MTFGIISWTDDRISKLIELFAEGLSASQIAFKLGGATRNSVIGKVSRLGLSRTNVPKKPKEPRAPRTMPSRNKQGDHHAVFRIVEGGFGSRRIIRSVESREEVKLRCVEVSPRNLTIDQLERLDCRYPYGDLPNITFCGNPVRDGKNMCGPHMDLCWVAPRPPQHKAAFGTVVNGRRVAS